MSFASLYGESLRQYVVDRGEPALSTAYELGRTAVRRRLGVLDLAAAHHEALATLQGEDTPEPDAVATTRAAGDFFLEALSAYEMVQRVLQEAQEAAEAERRQAAVLRRLSEFLGDASIAFDAASSFGEMLQLIAEHAREVVGAERCVVRALVDDDSDPVVAEAELEGGVTSDDEPIFALLTALDGRAMGSIEVCGKPGGGFSELDQALLVQLTQMASAAIERVQLYRR